MDATGALLGDSRTDSELPAFPARASRLQGLRNHFLPPIVLIVFCWFLFFLGLGDRDLHSSHEARAAQNAQVILQEGHWGLPRLLDRHLELQKPPLYYWLVAVLAQVLGQVDGWAVRLPAALSALGCVLFLYFLGKKCERPVAGFLAAVALATSLHFTWLARIGRIDMPLTLAVTVAVGSFYLGMRRRLLEPHARAWPWFALGYVAVSLGILLKGPIALALAGLIAGLFALLENQRTQPRPGLARLGAGSMLWGLPLVMLIAVPWFVWANYQTNNQIWDVFFRYHNFERGFGSEVLASHPFWFYLPRLVVDLLPWSFALPVALWLFRQVGWHADREARLGILWFLAVFVLLSCMKFKRADYLLPAYPGFALFLGCMAERWLRHTSSQATGTMASLTPAALLRTRRGIALTFVLACYVAGWGVYNVCVVPRQEAGWPFQRLARAIRAETDKPVIFFRAESHVLAFHVGRPLDTILEWENLEIWASQPFPVYFVMPGDCARDWPDYLTKGRLEEVTRFTDQTTGHCRTLVVMRSGAGN